MLGYIDQVEGIKCQIGPVHCEADANYGTEFYRLKFLALVQVARTFHQAGGVQLATEHIENAIRIEDKTGCEKIIGHLCWIVASRIYHNTNYKKAKFYFEKAIVQQPGMYGDEKDKFKN